MTNIPTANLSVLNVNNLEGKERKRNYELFRIRLASWCNQYIMEIAKPIMEHCSELYEDAAIRLLVKKWFDADVQYVHKRKSYLVQWESKDKYGFEPLDSYKWAKEERDAYNEALRALLIK